VLNISVWVLRLIAVFVRSVYVRTYTALCCYVRYL